MQEADEVARQPHEEMLHLEVGREADAGKVVEDDEVDVGGVVELEGAVLAHAEHDVAVGRPGAPIALPGGLAEKETYRGADGGVGRLRQAARHAHHRPDAGEVAQRGQQGDIVLEQAQVAHGVGNCVGTVDGAIEIAAKPGEAFLRRDGERLQEARWIAFDEGRQIGRGAEDAGKEIADGPLAQESAKLGQARLLSAASCKVVEHAAGALAVVDCGRCGNALMEWRVGHQVRILLSRLHTLGPTAGATRARAKRKVGLDGRD